MTDAKKALLVFEDGTAEEGRSLGASGTTFGEIVFNTAMSGYQEVLTDPSYRGQVVLMTYPLIGNYGVNPDDVESSKVHVNGFIVRERATVASSFRSTEDLDAYLKRHGIVAIDEVDTRALVLQVREKGALRVGISTEDLDPKSLLKKVLASPRTDGRDLAREVTRADVARWTTGLDGPFLPALSANAPTYRVVAYDFGIKTNILRSLVAANFDVTVVPATTPARDALALDPDGIFLSNGPGDPEPLHYAIDAIREFHKAQIPTFGICLGHQLTALALGAKTYKMKFGHHGANQPVMDLTTGKTEITSQNHSFAVDAATLDPKRARVTHKNLNDGTVEGLEVLDAPCFSVQYHPEASPGPHDSMYLFERFRDLIAKCRAASAK